MGDQVILAVDDDPLSLALVERELSRRYGADYRVVAAGSTIDALTVVEELAPEDELVLVLADHWMPDVNGLLFLTSIHSLQPHCRRVLLIDLGDRTATDAILRGTALGWIDDYVGKPWRTSDERFHRAISRHLSAWQAEYCPWFEVVQIIGDRLSERSHHLQDAARRNGVPYGFYPADSDEGRRLLKQAGVEGPLPVVILHDGRVFTDPSVAELAEAMGANVDPGNRVFDLAVLGAGPAGLAAAVYGASEGLSTLIVEQEAMGGQAGTSSLIRNYLGFPRGLSGAELATRAYEQAWLFGAVSLLGLAVTGLRAEGDLRVVELADGTEVSARSVVLALGVAYRRIGIPSVEALLGRGVFYGAAVTEARAMAGQEVFVVGGGNSAAQAALHLARYAELVTLLVRTPTIKESMSDYLFKEIEGADKVSVRLDTRIVEAVGKTRLEGLVLENLSAGGRETVPATAVFILIGAQPQTNWLPSEIERDLKGYILAGSQLSAATAGGPYRPFETSMPGVFTVGDVRSGSTKRVAAAVGEGSVAVRMIYEYLAGVGEGLAEPAG